MKKLLPLFMMVLIAIIGCTTYSDDFQDVTVSGDLKSPDSDATDGKTVYVKLYSSGYSLDNCLSKKSSYSTSSVFSSSSSKVTFKIKEVSQDLYTFFAFIDMDGDGKVSDNDYYYYSSSYDDDTDGDLNVDDDIDDCDVDDSDWETY